MIVVSLPCNYRTTIDITLKYNNKMEATNEYRVEHDLLGKRELPVDALYGIQTLRAHIYIVPK